MKKGLLLFLVFLAGTLMAVSSGWAISVPTEPLGIKFIDQTFSDLNYGNEPRSTFIDALPVHPQQDGTPTENIWGIVSMQGVYTLIDGQPELQNLSGDAYYNPGDDGKYYYGVFGGVTVISITNNNEVRLGVDPTSPEGAYLKIYEHDSTGAYDADVLAGPNVAGDGHWNTFGTNIISDGTLFLDLVYSPLTLANYDAGYVAGELELITLSSATVGAAEAYFDIIGGSGAGLFESNSFPFSFPGIPGSYADLKLVSDLTAQFVGGNWQSLWTASSEDPVTGVGVIPEPGTMLLLGTGLIGLAGVGRKKFLRK
jgi:hypothetical protein